MKWFTFSWYQYLFYSRSFKNLFCRITNHKPGVVWYDDGYGLEPNMYCKRCREYLG